MPGTGLALELGDEVGMSLAPFGLFLSGALLFQPLAFLALFLGALGFDLEGAFAKAANRILDSTRCLPWSYQLLRRGHQRQVESIRGVERRDGAGFLGGLTMRRSPAAMRGLSEGSRYATRGGRRSVT